MSGASRRIQRDRCGPVHLNKDSGSNLYPLVQALRAEFNGIEAIPSVCDKDRIKLLSTI
jgi:hypothetical protein